MTKPVGWRKEHARHVAAGKGMKTIPGARWSGKWRFYGLEWDRHGPARDVAAGKIVELPWYELVAWRYKGDSPYREGKIGKMVRSLISEQKDGSYAYEIYILPFGRVLGRGRTRDLEVAKRHGLKIASEYLKS